LDDAVVKFLIVLQRLTGALQAEKLAGRPSLPSLRLKLPSPTQIPEIDATQSNPRHRSTH
jgi:hypothetical protein